MSIENSQKTKPKRKYDSSKRQARALETQSNIIDTARELFIEKGYSGVTIEEISTRAQVSQETIYSVFKNKRTILSRAVGIAVETDVGPVPVMLQPYMQEVVSERNQHRQIQMFAKRMQMFLSYVAPLVEVMHATAKIEPEINSLLTKYWNDRFDGMGFFIDCLLANGPLRTGLSKLTAVETIGALVSAEIYSLLSNARRWSGEEYEAWLAESLERLLLS